MELPEAQSPAVPPGWAGRAPSRRPLRLMPAELFNRSYRPALDDYLHVAPLRRPPIGVMIACAVIVVLCALAVWGTLAQAGTTRSMEGPMPYIVAAGLGLLGVFFLLGLVNAVVASSTRGSWANRQCLAFGRSGIALRLQGADIDLPWGEVTAVRAKIRRQGRLGSIAVLRIERGEEHWELQPAVLDADPVAVCSALQFYWLHPERRNELGVSA